MYKKLYVIPAPPEGVSAEERSGVTMLAGIDVGQGKKKEIYNIIKNLGISEEDSSSFKKAVDAVAGLKGPAARKAFNALSPELLKKANLFLEVHGQDVQTAYQKKEAPLIEKTYNTIAKSKGIQFKNLPRDWQTVIASAFIQYGPAGVSKQKLFREIAKGDFSAAIKNLKSWGDKTPGYAAAINKRYSRYGHELVIPAVPLAGE
jgi:hypothetical protein